MVVLVIIGILAALATMAISTGGYAATTRGFAEQVAAQVEAARMRASSTRRWQRLAVSSNAVAHWEASNEGLATPSDWQLIEEVPAPSGVRVAALDNRTHLTPGDGVPTIGAGLDGTVEFAPDGAAEAATLFIGDDDGSRRSRVAIYRATGTVYVFEGW